MNVPTGYTALDMVGFTDKGTYNSATAYVKNDIAHYGGNLWRCLVDDTTGVTPAEGVNWTVFLAEPTSAAEDIIAQVETTSTAAHSYAVGKQLIYNDTLYTVTSAITVGDTLTVGTNITASDSIVDQLDTKANSSDLATIATTGAYSDLSGKPTLGTAAEKNVPASGDASSSEVVMGDDTRLSNARNAADVSAWAKAANKPTYNGAEILTSTAKTGTAQLSISDTVASGTSMDNVVGTMLNNDKTLDTNVSSLNEALTNEVTTRATNGAHNLLPNVASTEVKNGVTFTVNADKSVTVSTSAGGATANAIIALDTEFKPKAGTYIVSTGILDSKFYVTLDAYNGNTWVRGLGTTANGNLSLDITYSGYDTIRVYLAVLSGGVYTTPKTAYPMIRLASDTDTTYQPYAMTNRELTEKSYAKTRIPLTGSVNGYATIVKTNGICVFHIENSTFINNVVANTPNLIGTLPEEFRPITLLRCTLTVTSGYHNKTVDYPLQLVLSEFGEINIFTDIAVSEHLGIFANIAYVTS